MIIIFFIILFSFLFYYKQLYILRKKANVIQKAIHNNKETYLDPVTWKTHWTKNGKTVQYTVLNSLWKFGHQGAIPGDKVIIDLNTLTIYRNFSKEEYFEHVQQQISNKKCWCGERKTYRDIGYATDECLKYHIQDQYFYKLKYEIKWKKKENNIGKVGTIYCYKYTYNIATQSFNEPIEIQYKDYVELGGERQVSDTIIRHY